MLNTIINIYNKFNVKKLIFILKIRKFLSVYTIVRRKVDFSSCNDDANQVGIKMTADTIFTIKKRIKTPWCLNGCF